MKRLSIRVRFTLWFAIMLLIMTNAGFHMAFIALQDVIANQMESSLARDGVIIANSINMRDGMLVIELNDTNMQLMTPGVHYALFSPPKPACVTVGRPTDCRESLEAGEKNNCGGGRDRSRGSKQAYRLDK